jgi:RNase adaptor protein for sRNA GlmZ degradation
MNPIKLVYDRFENETGFVMTDEQGGHIHTKIEGIRDKEITFYTWGQKMHEPKTCDLVFDATLFSTKVSVDVKCLSGLDEVIQQGIINHPNFDLIIGKIITLIEENKPTTVGIFCNYGKHRSVGWTELLKKLYYPKSTCIHEGICL